MKRREFVGRFAGGACAAWFASSGMGCDGEAERLGVGAAGGLYWAWWGWEPLDHYRRTGGVVGAVDTAAPWMPQWYERLHSEEVVRMMGDLGVNLACTHFFKGFGMTHERAEQRRTAALVERAHRHGIKVLGYCQSRSIYHEIFLGEVTDAEGWIQRDEKGQLRTWGGTKFRWAPCILCGEFRDYLKRVIRAGIEEIRLDGFHFDNNYCEPCYCPRCERAFRAWLAKRHPGAEARFGLASFADVRLPPTEKAPARIVDPLVQEWVRWRCECLAEYQGDLSAHARALKPDILLLGNPAYPRDANSAYRRSVWAPWLGRHLDLMFAENGNFPGIEEGALVSQVRGCKNAAAVGYRVVSTVWKRNKLSALGLPESEREVGLQIAESAANGAVPGANWALRPLGEGDRMRVERADLREALAQHLGFARRVLPEAAGARPVQDVVVLQTFASMTFDNEEANALVFGAEEVLIRSGFAWGTVFGDDMDRLAGASVLVVAGQTHLSDAEIEAIRTFVRRGGAVVLVGDDGRRDESGHERAAFGGFYGDRVFRVGAEAVRASIGFSHATRVAFPEKRGGFVEAIERAGGERIAVRLRGADAVALSAWELGGNRMAVHLVNYAAGDTPAGLRLEFGVRWQGCRAARLLTPDGSERALLVNEDLGRYLEVPVFGVYAVVMVG